MVHNLEEPFFQAEMHKIELARENNAGDGTGNVLATAVVLAMPLIFILAGVLHG
jgi:hypothetical protein